MEFTYPTIGEKVYGYTLYGKGNKLTGEIIAIDPLPQDRKNPYHGNDTYTVKWDDGQIAKFYASDIRRSIERHQAEQQRLHVQADALGITITELKTMEGRI